MPGHVKRGGTGDPDPDPSPFLLVSYEDHQKDLAKVIKSEGIHLKLFIYFAFKFYSPMTPNDPAGSL